MDIVHTLLQRKKFIYIIFASGFSSGYILGCLQYPGVDDLTRTKYLQRRRVIHDISG